MKIILSKSQWEKIGEKAGWAGGINGIMGKPTSWTPAPFTPDPFANEDKAHMEERINLVVWNSLKSYSIKLKTSTVKTTINSKSQKVNVMVTMGKAPDENKDYEKIKIAKTFLSSESGENLIRSIKNIAKLPEVVIHFISPTGIEI